MPKWRELKRYLEKDKWELYKDTDHYYFRKVLEDGTLLRTRVSKGSGEIPKRLWQEIMKRQLKITQEEFNKKI